MVERTLVDEIISIIHSEANNNPLPVKCTIHETYPNGLIDVLLENGTILTYLPVIGSPRVGDTGVLLYLDDEKNNQIIITNGGSGGGSTDVSWGNILNKPSTFPPSTHTHLSSDVTDFDLDSIEDNLRYEVLCFTDNTLSTECYNFDIDSTVYIIVTAFNVYGDSVSVGSSEVLTVNTVSGVSSLSGSQRVTYNGVETNLYVYSASEWGQCRFSIKTYDTFINVEPKWEQILYEEHYELYVKKDRVRFLLNLDAPTSFPSKITDFGGGAHIPVGYRPWGSLTAVNIGNSNTVAVIKRDGTVARRSLTGSAINATGWFRWEYTI